MKNAPAAVESGTAESSDGRSVGQDAGQPVSCCGGHLVRVCRVQHDALLSPAVHGPDRIVDMKACCYMIYPGSGHEGGMITTRLEETLHGVLYVEGHVAPTDPLLKVSGDLPLAGRILRHEGAHLRPHLSQSVSEVTEKVVVLIPD